MFTITKPKGVRIPTILRVVGISTISGEEGIREGERGMQLVEQLEQNEQESEARAGGRGGSMVPAN